jgi:hypothetical protein
MMFVGENQGTRRKTCPSATLSTTNTTWTDQGANPGLGCEKPATNRLSYGTTLVEEIPANWKAWEDHVQADEMGGRR